MAQLINEKTLTGEVRAARDSGMQIDDALVIFSLHIADFLELPNDTLFVAAVTAVMREPVQLNDPASLARMRDIALAAGYGKPPPPTSGLA